MTWLQLANRTAVVTGAASGIGAAVTRALLEADCRVVAADTRSVNIANDVLSVECDVTNPQQVQSLIKESPEATLLVNCAGITRDGWVHKMTLPEWDDVVDVNLKGTFLTCQAFVDPARQLTDISIVNVGSIVSEFGNLGQANYAASKGGVVGLTRALAKECASRDVRVNAVLPGFIDTPMAQAVPDIVKKTKILPNIPLQRLGKPEEVANLVAFLLSPRSSYITGEAIRVSGMIAL